MEGKRVALLTGAAGGLGFAAGRELARTGVKVLMADMDQSRAEKAAETLRSQGLDVLGAFLDVTNRAAVDAFITAIPASHGRLDILVNLAGIVRNDYLTKV